MILGKRKTVAGLKPPIVPATAIRRTPQQNFHIHLLRIHDRAIGRIKIGLNVILNTPTAIIMTENFQIGLFLKILNHDLRSRWLRSPVDFFAKE